MKRLLHWFDQGTGLLTSLGNWFQRPLAGGPAWRFVWPTTIAFAFVVQAITGLVLWMYYSAGAQSSWESVYYLQYHVIGGWLLRAMHFYMGQATLVLVGIYLVQMILRGAYRGPREFLFWTVLLMGLATLGLNLTGDLLPWDQNSFWATSIRVGYLSHLPVVGPWLCKLAIGGPQFGSLTITRFLALHVGPCTAALLVLILFHAHLAFRFGLEASNLPSPSGRGAEETSDLPSPSGRGAGGEGTLRQDQPTKGDPPGIPLTPALSRRARGIVPYWPQQAWRDAAACFIVLAVVVGLSVRHGVSGPQAGIELGAPANPVEDPGTARPEWSFRGLYQLHETLGGWPELISIFTIPGLTLLLFFAMPYIGRNAAGRAVNIALTVLVLGGLAVLTWQSYSGDAKNEKYQAAREEGRRQAQRVEELAVRPSPEEIQKAKASGSTPARIPRIPASGALTLLRTDAKTRGPSLFNQHCASCHDYSGPAGGINRPDTPTAADLYGFAGREWLSEFLTVKGIASPKFFGNTKFKRDVMYRFIKETFQGEDIKPEERQRIILALSAEARLKSQIEADAGDAAGIEAGKKLMGVNPDRESCADCHAFHGPSGGTGVKGPDLTGYGSREWLIGIVANAAHPRFYGKINDRMPAYAEWADDTAKNLLSRQDLELLVDWMRGEWYGPANQ